MIRVKLVSLLPSHSSAQDLTERFSAHFIDKITNCDLTYLTVQLPRQLRAIYNLLAVHALAKFTEVFAKVVSETIGKSASKSCPSYPILTRTLKSCLDELLSPITSLGLCPCICPIGAPTAPENKESLVG